MAEVEGKKKGKILCPDCKTELLEVTDGSLWCTECQEQKEVKG